jgi:hypothetical protein
LRDVQPAAIPLAPIERCEDSAVSPLPPVTPLTRERIAREFDDRGPPACMAEIEDDLRRHNPELLDMASRCARSLGDDRRIMMGFGMFYRLLLAPSDAGGMLSPLPRVTAHTRDMIVRTIDSKGSEAFTMDVIAELETNNPELLQMAHGFASRQKDYLSVMQGFALVYRSISEQLAADRRLLH